MVRPSRLSFTKAPYANHMVPGVSHRNFPPRLIRDKVINESVSIRQSTPSGALALRSHCGFMVNDARNAGSAEMQLKAGDRIHYGFEFVFDVVGGHDVK